jgi:hypothetical protein
MRRIGRALWKPQNEEQLSPYMKAFEAQRKQRIVHEYAELLDYHTSLVDMHRSSSGNLRVVAEEDDVVSYNVGSRLPKSSSTTTTNFYTDKNATVQEEQHGLHATTTQWACQFDLTQSVEVSAFASHNSSIQYKDDKSNAYSNTERRKRSHSHLEICHSTCCYDWR